MAVILFRSQNRKDTFILFNMLEKGIFFTPWVQNIPLQV